MAKHINGINPDILKWARERSGYTTEAIATFLKKDVSIVNDWESGERALTYVQLEKLADKYKRPIAIFFFPEPPEEPNIAENIALRSSDNQSVGAAHPYSIATGLCQATFLNGIEHGHEPCRNEDFSRPSGTT